MTVFLDFETTGLDPRRGAEIRLVSLDGAIYDVMYGSEWEIPDVKKELEARKYELLVGHNIAFDLDFLYTWWPGFRWEGPIFDTMMAVQMLTNGKKYSASLDNVALDIVGEQLNKAYQKIDWSAWILEEDALAYAAKDTEILPPIYQELNRQLKRNGLSRLFKFEMELLPVVLDMKRRGVRINQHAARKLADELRGEAYFIEKQIRDTLPEDVRYDFNPKSPTHIAHQFDLPNAQEDTLREYVRKTQNPLAKEIMEIRKRLKKKSTIEKQLLGRIAPDGRIHPSFTQTTTETGRFSSREPNLQNQDRGYDIRSLFIPGPGNELVVADYSQIEVRIAALLSRDPVMLQAYKDGRDLHEETQRRIFGDPNQMNYDMARRTRSLSKNINFAYLFGGGHQTLLRFAAKQDVQIDASTAKRYHKEFQAAYPTLVKWQKREGTSMNEYVYSVRGRRRYIDPGKAYCTRINHGVQATAADAMKAAIWFLYKRHGIVPILTVHDELVLEVPDVGAEEVKRILVEEMRNGWWWATKQDPSNPVIDIEVEAAIGQNWAEAH